MIVPIVATTQPAAQIAANSVSSYMNPPQASKSGHSALCWPHTSRQRRSPTLLCSQACVSAACHREVFGRQRPQTAAIGVMSYTCPLQASQQQGALCSFELTRPANVKSSSMRCGLFFFYVFLFYFAPSVCSQNACQRLWVDGIHKLQPMA